MNKIFLVFCLALSLAACAPPAYLINLPPGNSVGVVVSSANEQTGVWRPDPTVRWIRNYSQTVFIKIWFDSKAGPPMIEMGPEEARRISLDLGKHMMYTQGQMKAGPYGRRDLGEFSRDIYINAGDYPGLEIPIGLWDFPRAQYAGP